MQSDKQLIPRKLLRNIKERLFRNKAIIIYGPRQVGKTTLVNSLFSDLAIKEQDYRYLNGDDFDVREMLSKPNIVKLEGIIGKSKIVFIDEAQRIPEIGIIIKIIVDRIKDVQVIATGSSSFLLAQRIKEPLTGRAYEFILHPLTFGELVEHTSLFDEKRKLERRLVYGSYPEIVTSLGEEQKLLELLSGSYLYRDLFVLRTVSRPELLEKITKAIAFQVGSEVSSVEIGQLVGADRLTVEKYIDLLEKAFIVFRLPALNRNVRNEIKKGKKIYFYDNGIRNAVIKNFNDITSRNDVGALWENYCVSERIKFIAYTNSLAQSYFWRTTQRQEIDYIEEDGNSFSAFEFKFNPSAKTKFSKTFLGSYSVSQTKVITPDNVEEFVM